MTTLTISPGITIDLGRIRVCRAGVPVHLTPSEFRMLAYLAQNAGTVIGHTELGKAMGTVENPATSVKVVVRRIRRKLGASVITNERGWGYLVEAGA